MADILKSYLISIGFKIDEQDYKKFKDSQLETEKRTKDLSKAFSDFAKIGIGSAVALGGMVLKVSSSLENLHFQAQKSGTSAQNLKAFGDAAAQIGIQSEDAMGMVQKLNNQIRDNPMGMGALLGNLGVNANQEKVKVMLDLVDSLAKISGPNADVMRTAYGSQFGLSGEDVRTLIRGREELNKYYEERRLVYGDIDRQSLAAHKANEEFRDLEARFSALTNTIGTSFLPLAKSVVSILEVVVQDLIAADHATAGWSSKILGLGAAAVSAGGALKLLGVIKGIPGIGGSIPGSTVATVAGAGLLGGALANWGINIAADTNDIKAQSGYDSVANSNRSEMAYIRMYKSETGKTPEENYLAYNAWKRQKIAGRFGAPSSISSTSNEFNNPGNLRSWGNTPTEERFRGGVSIGSFAKFGSAQDGLDAMAGLLTGKGYAGAGINTISGILNKYAPGKENNTSAYIADVAGRTGFGANARLNLSDPNTLSSLMAAMIHHEQGRDPYSMSMISDSANRRLVSSSGGSGGVRIDQKTEINVNGPASASATADLVAKQQDRVNAGMARNFAGATQ